MAPEQIRGDRIDGRTDLYSLGVILYEAVTGVPPFQGETEDEIFDARLNGKPRLPRELNGGITEQVEEILLHAMAPKPADRYASATAMKAELDCPGSVSVTGKYADPAKPSPWPKRLRTAGLILGVGSVPFILFYLFLLIFERQLAR
jgi:serine/threonine-protein kinase